MMKKIFVFSCLIYAGICTTLCESSETPKEPKDCHVLETELDNSYCCYYKGKNLDTQLEEINCWEFKKSRIDDDQVFDTISQIEKGTDDHVTKKHENVQLDCYGSYLKNYLIIFALLFIL